MLSLFTGQIRVELKTGIDIVDISDKITRLIRESGIDTGSVNATVIGSTGSITTIEHEPGVVEDLRQAINRMAPPDIVYEHEKAWHDGNGHSHVQAAILGPSIVLPVRGGSLNLGTWQQVVVINHDNRARERRVDISIIGEKTEA
ncbi:MAG: secondary thiamine-phosphate synthase enzyme YjbQ [Desulfobacterales bacterium]|nr:secondary thiamine-phosphate synthase enzyme YjbQ [Desulfobacterales bacterium]